MSEDVVKELEQDIRFRLKSWLKRRLDLEERNEDVSLCCRGARMALLEDLVEEIEGDDVDEG